MKKLELLCAVLIAGIPIRGGCIKGASKAISKAGAAKTAAHEAEELARITGKTKLLPHMPVHVPARSFQVAAHVQHSKAVGNRLIRLRPRVPPQVYAHLFRQWQTNDSQLGSDLAQVKQLENQCTCGQGSCPTCARRHQLEEHSSALAARNAEIERLLSQYG